MGCREAVCQRSGGIPACRSDPPCCPAPQELGRRLGVPNLPALPLPGAGLASFPLPLPRQMPGHSPAGSSGRATEADEAADPQLPGDINVEEAR